MWSTLPQDTKDSRPHTTPFPSPKNTSLYHRTMVQDKKHLQQKEKGESSFLQCLQWCTALWLTIYNVKKHLNEQSKHEVSNMHLTTNIDFIDRKLTSFTSTFIYGSFFIHKMADCCVFGCFVFSTSCFCESKRAGSEVSSVFWNDNNICSRSFLTFFVRWSFSF
jgi:hypothetical protein